MKISWWWLKTILANQQWKHSAHICPTKYPATLQNNHFIYIENRFIRGVHDVFLRVYVCVCALNSSIATVHNTYKSFGRAKLSAYIFQMQLRPIIRTSTYILSYWISIRLRQRMYMITARFGWCTGMGNGLLVDCYWRMLDDILKWAFSVIDNLKSTV